MILGIQERICCLSTSHLSLFSSCGRMQLEEGQQARRRRVSAPYWDQRLLSAAHEQSWRHLSDNNTLCTQTPSWRLHIKPMVRCLVVLFTVLCASVSVKCRVVYLGGVAILEYVACHHHTLILLHFVCGCSCLLRSCKRSGGAIRCARIAKTLPAAQQRSPCMPRRCT
jgi:hypothetical protein